MYSTRPGRIVSKFSQNFNTGFSLLFALAISGLKFMAVANRKGGGSCKGYRYNRTSTGSLVRYLLDGLGPARQGDCIGNWLEPAVPGLCSGGQLATRSQVSSCLVIKEISHV